MAEENTPQTTPTPASNQNLIIGLVLGAVVLLLFLLVLQVKMKGGGGGGDSTEFAELKREVSEARQRVNDERRLLGLPPLGSGADGQTIASLAARISSDSSALSSLANQLQSILTEKETLLASADDARRALTLRITELQREADQARLAAGEASILQNKLTETRALLESANQRLANVPSSAEMTSLRQNLDNALADRDRFEKMVQDLNNQLVGKVDGAQLSVLMEKVAKLEPENNQLRYEVWDLRAKLNRTLLFVEKIDDLPAAAKLLYTELAKLETASPAELQAAYARLDGGMKAKVIDTISFPTGSSRVNLDKVEEIRLKHQSAGPGSFYLIVGYASKTGDIDKNRELSAARATALASVAHQHKQGNQQVRAVYLGQTDRFSASNPLQNQICEIWEIREQ